MYEALSEDIGVLFEVDGDRERARQKMYQLRKKHAPTFDQLSFIISPFVGTNDIMILKGKPDGQET